MFGGPFNIIQFTVDSTPKKRKKNKEGKKETNPSDLEKKAKKPKKGKSLGAPIPEIESSFEVEQVLAKRLVKVCIVAIYASYCSQLNRLEGQSI